MSAKIYADKFTLVNFTAVTKRKEHLEHTDFILAKQKQDAERTKAEKEATIAAKNKMAELTQALVTEKQKAEAERDRALVQSRSLGMERDKAVRQFKNSKPMSNSISAMR